MIIEGTRCLEIILQEAQSPRIRPLPPKKAKYEEKRVLMQTEKSLENPKLKKAALPRFAISLVNPPPVAIMTIDL